MKKRHFKSIIFSAMAFLLLGLTACKKEGEHLVPSDLFGLRAELPYVVDKNNHYRIQFGATVLADSLSYDRPSGELDKYFAENELKNNLKVWRLADGKEILELDTNITFKPDEIIGFLQPSTGAKLQLANNFTDIAANLLMAPSTDNIYRVKFGETVLGDSLSTGDYPLVKSGSGWVPLTKLKDKLRIWLINGGQETLVLEQEKELRPGETLNLVHTDNSLPVGLAGGTVPDSESKSTVIFMYDNLFSGQVKTPEKVTMYITVANYKDKMAATKSNRINFTLLAPLMDTVGVVELTAGGQLSLPLELNQQYYGSYTSATDDLRPYFFYTLRDSETKALIKDYVHNTNGEIGIRKSGSIAKYKVGVFRISLQNDAPLTFNGQFIGGEEW